MVLNKKSKIRSTMLVFRVAVLGALVSLVGIFIATAETTINKSTKVIILKDSDGDGVLDKDDPHPNIAEIYIAKDDNLNGIVDYFEIEENWSLSEDISQAESLDELVSIIEKNGGIQGSSEFFSSEKIKDIISKVESGELEAAYITRTGGLRDRVEYLIASKEENK